MVQFVVLPSERWDGFFVFCVAAFPSVLRSLRRFADESICDQGNAWTSGGFPRVVCCERMLGGGRGGYLFVACLSHLTFNPASLS